MAKCAKRRTCSSRVSRIAKKDFASIERKQTGLNRNQEKLYEDQLSPDLVTAGVTGYCPYEMSNCLPVDNDSSDSNESSYDSSDSSDYSFDSSGGD